MSNASHTRGPWRLVFNRLNKMAVVGPHNDGATTTSDRICNLPHRKRGEGEANARLIAAAPEMYEALADLLALGILNPTGSKAVEQATARARDALAKAEGRA